MRCYRGRKPLPAGSSTRPFALLSAAEQAAAVRRLAASGLSTPAIAQLTGLYTPAIDAILLEPLR